MKSAPVHPVFAEEITENAPFVKKQEALIRAPAPVPAPYRAPAPKNYPQPAFVPRPEPNFVPNEPDFVPAEQPKFEARFVPNNAYPEPVLKAFEAVPEDHVVAYESPVAYQEEPLYEPAPKVYREEKVYNEPIEVVAAAPEPAPAPVAPAASPIVPAPGGVVASQYHAQDEFGNVVYGYSNPNSAKTGQRDAYGNVVGSYSYVDGTGYPKHVSYVADDFGFRITAANNLPVGPA